MIIEIPTGGIPEIITYLGTLITDLWPVIALVVGVILSFDVINKIIKLVARVVADKIK